MANAELRILLRSLDQAFDHKAWHGTNLRGSLRGLTLAEVMFRPARGRHNIWELAMHCAYWKYAVRRRLTGEKRGSFPLKGSNFFTRPDGDRSREAWKRDLILLDQMHTALRATVAALPARRLDEVPPGGTFAARDVVLGIAAHDLYHTGQIQLLKRLARSQGMP